MSAEEKSHCIETTDGQQPVCGWADNESSAVEKGTLHKGIKAVSFHIKWKLP